MYKVKNNIGGILMFKELGWITLEKIKRLLTAIVPQFYCATRLQASGTGSSNC